MSTHPFQPGFRHGLLLVSMPLFSMMGAVLLAPLLPAISREFATTPHATLIVPLLLTIPAMFQALCSPLAGFFSNRFGSQRMMFFSLALYALAGTAPIYLGSLASIAASRALVGIAEAGIVTSATTLVAAYFSGDERQKWYAYQNIVLPLAVIGLLQFTGLVGDFQWRATFIVYALALLMLIAAVILLPSEDPSRHARSGRFFPRARITWLAATIAVPGSILFYVAPVEISFLLHQRGYAAPSDAATVISLGVGFGAFGALLTRRITHWRTGGVLSIAMCLMGAGLVVMALSTTFFAIAAGMVLQQMGGGIMVTTSMTYIISLAQPEERGCHTAAFIFFYMLAQFVAPLMMAALTHGLGSRPQAIVAAGLIGAATSGWLLTWRPLKRAVVAASDDSTSQRGISMSEMRKA